MAKKRRSRRRQKRRTPVAAARPAQPLEEKRREAKTEPEVKAVALAEEYPYVYADLRRIAILAGTMFAILIILSFFIR